MDLFTEAPNLANQYSDVCYFKKDIDQYWYKLSKITKSGCRTYVGDDSFKSCLRLMSFKQETVRAYREKNIRERKN